MYFQIKKYTYTQCMCIKSSECFAFLKKKNMSTNCIFTTVATNNADQLTFQRNESFNGNFKSENSLPGSSRENKISDEEVSKCSELQKLSSITSSVVESQLRHFFQDKIVDREVSQLMTDYCNYKLAEILKASTDYMKKCGRLKFTIEDFKKGLAICGESPIILPSIVRKSKLKPEDDKKIQNICKKVPRVYLKEMWLNRINLFSPSINSLPVQLKKYFKAVTDVLLLSDEGFIHIVLNDLQISRDIFQLVPHFTNFFCDGISTFKFDFIKIYVLLKLITSVLRNPFIFFGHDSYSNTLACTLLKFVVSDLPMSDQGKDCWLLKDTAANIIAFILNKSKNQHLFFDVLYFIQSVLLTFENSLNSHYGALVVLNSIGVPAILLVLPLYVHRFHEHVKMILSSGNQKRTDVHMVQGQIILSYHILVNYYFKNEIKRAEFTSAHHFNSKFFLPDYLKDIKVFPIISQSFFSDYFGEALLPSFPSLNYSSHSTYLRNKRRTNKRELKKGRNNNALNSSSELMETNV